MVVISHKELSLREPAEGCRALEVRRCLFIANAFPPPPKEGPIPALVPGVIRDPARPVGMLLVVLDRGLEEDEASLGRLVPPFRVAPLGAPEVRFLSKC